MQNSLSFYENPIVKFKDKNITYILCYVYFEVKKHNNEVIPIISI